MTRKAKQDSQLRTLMKYQAKISNYNCLKQD